MTEVNQEILWDNVYDARTAVFEKKFGLFPDEILKLGHMTGVWPGGGLFKSKASELGDDLWLYTTFGLTNRICQPSTCPKTLIKQMVTLS